MVDKRNDDGLDMKSKIIINYPNTIGDFIEVEEEDTQGNKYTILTEILEMTISIEPLYTCVVDVVLESGEVLSTKVDYDIVYDTVEDKEIDVI